VKKGMGIDSVGMGGSGNVNSHFRSSLPHIDRLSEFFCRCCHSFGGFLDQSSPDLELRFFLTYLWPLASYAGRRPFCYTAVV